MKTRAASQMENDHSDEMIEDGSENDNGKNNNDNDNNGNSNWDWNIKWTDENEQGNDKSNSNENTNDAKDTKKKTRCLGRNRDGSQCRRMIWGKRCAQHLFQGPKVIAKKSTKQLNTK